MICKEGYFLSTNTLKTVDVGFNPKIVFAWTNTSSTTPAIYTDTFWMQRTNGLGKQLSYLNGISIAQNTITFGLNANIQTNGKRTFWVAIGDDGSEDFEITDYMGNGLDNRTVLLQIQKQIKALLIKRDAEYTGIAKFGEAATGFLDGVFEAGTPIESIGVGSFVVDNFTCSNHYNGPAALGEGHCAFAVFDGSPNADVVTWAGGSADGTHITTISADPAFAIIYETTSAAAGMIVSRSMTQDGVKPTTTTGTQGSAVRLVYGGIRLGSSGTFANVVGKTYYALVIGRRVGYENKQPAKVLTGKKAIFLPGRGIASYVDCGSSDATLKIDGAISLEWYGCIQYLIGSYANYSLMIRGNGPFGVSPGAYSWGVFCAHPDEGGHGWSTPNVLAINRDYLSSSAGDMAVAPWRTGIVVPNNGPCHILITHDGNGLWKMFLDGKLVKQRNQSLSPNIQSGAGHKTLIGARYSSAAYVDNLRMLFMGASVWSRELTPDEAKILFANRLLEASETISQTGLAEEWLASGASGTSLPATVNAANNGTIVLGRVVTL